MRLKKLSLLLKTGLSSLFLLLITNVAFAAEAGHEIGLDGADLSLWWTIPFAGILLSIALFPLFAEEFWHHHFGKVSAFWAALIIVPMVLTHGFDVTLYEILHTYLLEYIPFIILLFALFTISGGVRVKGTLRGTPEVNTLMLFIGTVLASWMGTTGAAMLMIRPLLRANEWRENKKHMVIFFIFMVANIGGSLTPLGDPPLFLGFLQGVDFFWTTQHLLHEMSFVIVILLAVYYVWDRVMYNKEKHKLVDLDEEKEPLGIEGGFNLLLLAGVVGAVLFSGVYKNMGEFTVFHVHVKTANVIRDVTLLILSGISWVFTSKQSRAANGFTWFPILEVGKLFAGIFVTIIPAILILRAGEEGALHWVVDVVSNADGSHNPDMYFWITGSLSSFLDNAPTYLVFFNTAGGNAQQLMTELDHVLQAISSGAVFMGAMTYIGNAPNFMVKSIAESSGADMPSFLGYMAWSVGILVPIFILVTWIFI